MLTPPEAEKIILKCAVNYHREDCPLESAHGRVLRADLAADRDLPPFNRVAMDGYALRSSALAAGVRKFKVQTVQAAGMRAFTLVEPADTCIEIMTGAVLPVGADCVVPYEQTTRSEKTVSVDEAGAKLAAGHAIHARGSDHRKGEIVVPAGTRMSGREIAVAAAFGRAVVTVSQLPKIAVVATGDELVDIGMPVAAHQIRRSNDYAMRAALLGAGYPKVERFHLRDVPHEVEHVLWHLIAEYDVVIIMGGVSKGRFDHIPGELEKQGVKKRFHGVAQRPGKPMWFGVSARHSMVFALPGNPVSCYTCLHRYVLPALDHSSGLAVSRPRRVSLAQAVNGPKELTYFVPVKLEESSGPEQRAQPIPVNTSGDFGGLIGTDGFIELAPRAEETPAGTVASFWPWRG